MDFGFKLKVPLLRVGAIVALQSPFDVDRMGIVAFDEIAVIAVHRPDESGQFHGDHRRHGRPQGRGLLGKLDGKIDKFGAPERALADHHRLHHADILVPILGTRFNVRFHVRFHVRGCPARC
ncbi:hypothetical protein ACFQ4K_18165 [Tistrella bauzanensis]